MFALRVITALKAPDTHISARVPLEHGAVWWELRTCPSAHLALQGFSAIRLDSLSLQECVLQVQL